MPRFAGYYSRSQPLSSLVPVVYQRARKAVKQSLPDYHSYCYMDAVGIMVRAPRQDPLDEHAERIASLERRLASLTRKVQRLSSVQNGAAELRRLTKDQARVEIMDLFQSGGTLYYSDIVQKLGIDIEDVIEICRELEAEGRIETLGDAAKPR